MIKISQPGKQNSTALARSPSPPVLLCFTHKTHASAHTHLQEMDAEVLLRAHRAISTCQLACFGQCHKSVEHQGLRCPFPSFASWEEAARGGGEGKAGPCSKPVAWLGFHSSSLAAPRSQPALRGGPAGHHGSAARATRFVGARPRIKTVANSLHK